MKYLVACMNIVLGDNHVQNTQALVSFKKGMPLFVAVEKRNIWECNDIIGSAKGSQISGKY
jgi:hypothetical protein